MKNLITTPQGTFIKECTETCETGCPHWDYCNEPKELKRKREGIFYSLISRILDRLIKFAMYQKKT
jgi:hypothetical protein